MASIKKINDVAGVGNPVQIQDLQQPMEGFDALALPTRITPSITAGFIPTSDTAYGPGVISLGGQAYYSTGCSNGQYLYAEARQTDARIYADNAERYFYTEFIVNTSTSGTATGIGTLIGGPVNSDLIALWKSPVIAPGYLSTEMYGTASIPRSALQQSAIEGGIAGYSEFLLRIGVVNPSDTGIIVTGVAVQGPQGVDTSNWVSNAIGTVGLDGYNKTKLRIQINTTSYFPAFGVTGIDFGALAIPYVNCPSVSISTDMPVASFIRVTRVNSSIITMDLYNYMYSALLGGGTICIRFLCPNNILTFN